MAGKANWSLGLLLIVSLALLATLAIQDVRDRQAREESLRQRIAFGKLEVAKNQFQQTLLQIEHMLVSLSVELETLSAQDRARALLRQPLVRTWAAFNANCQPQDEIFQDESWAVALPDLIAACRPQPQRESFLESQEKPSTNSGWQRLRWEGPSTRALYWFRKPQGGLVVLEVPLFALISRLVEKLPDTPSAVAPEEGQIQWLDETSARVYHWGKWTPTPSELPAANWALNAPFQGFQLQVFLPAPSLSGSWEGPRRAAVWIVGGILFAIWAWILIRDWNRQMRDAATKVSFVNQVSHELRTPLTNIRLYAELLQDEMFESEAHLQNRIRVIVTETARLSRLIGNVLSFAQSKKNQRQLSYKPAVVDALIHETLMQFTPAFDEKKLLVETQLAASEPTWVDADAISQVLFNLLSNVEKYVPTGSRVSLSSSQEGLVTCIRIHDEGPGIALSEFERVFLPFERLNHHLTEGVSGSGLGLTISRHLARLHGGDLKLIPVSSGSCFEFTLRSHPPSENPR